MGQRKRNVNIQVNTVADKGAIDINKDIYC